MFFRKKSSRKKKQDASGAQILLKAPSQLKSIWSPASKALALENRILFDGSIDLDGKEGWTAVMYGTTQDPDADTQANAADTDIIGDAAHGSLYTAYDDNNTSATTDDFITFRMRIDNPTSSTNFAGVAIVGIDANLDGKIDLFMSVDGRNNTQAVRLLDPGSDANISPSTTSTLFLKDGCRITAFIRFPTQASIMYLQFQKQQTLTGAHLH